jgi:glycine/D-amino acid oxidase-like deaminating enzyme
MTPDGNFIIDFYNPNTLIVSLTGHGFKFAPVIAEIITNLTLDEPVRYDITPFKLSRF